MLCFSKGPRLVESLRYKWSEKLDHQWQQRFGISYYLLDG